MAFGHTANTSNKSPQTPFEARFFFVRLSPSYWSYKSCLQIGLKHTYVRSKQVSKALECSQIILSYLRQTPRLLYEVQAVRLWLKLITHASHTYHTCNLGCRDLPVHLPSNNRLQCSKGRHYEATIVLNFIVLD